MASVHHGCLHPQWTVLQEEMLSLADSLLSFSTFYLFIWLSQFLVVACGIFITPCGMFVVAHGLSSGGTQAQELQGTGLVAPWHVGS